MNKKGFLDFIADFFFLIVISVFILMFVGFALEFGIHNAQEKSKKEVASFNDLSKEIMELRNQLVQGKEMNMTEMDLALDELRKKELVPSAVS